MTDDITDCPTCGAQRDAEAPEDRCVCDPEPEVPTTAHQKVQHVLYEGEIGDWVAKITLPCRRARS